MRGTVRAIDGRDWWALLGTYLPWVVGIILLVSGIAMVLSPESGLLTTVRSVIAGLLFAGIGLLVLPPTREEISTKIDRNYTTPIMALAILMGLVVAAGIAPPVADAPEDDSGEDAAPAEPTDEDDDGNDSNQDNDSAVDQRNGTSDPGG